MKETFYSHFVFSISLLIKERGNGAFQLAKYLLIYCYKYFFVFDTDKRMYDPVEIFCDYVRIRSELICNEQDLDNLIATLTRYGVNQKGTRAFIIVYYKLCIINFIIGF